MNFKRGFTLIELLIVIAILGVLAAAVTIVLNPAELLAQARDGQRMSDMDTVRSALNTYLSQTTSTPSLDVIGGGAAASGGYCSFVNAVSTTTRPFGYGNVATGTPAGLGATQEGNKPDGTGWVDVAFNRLPGGSPLSLLPVDPAGSGSNTYCYVGNNTATAPNYTFKLATRMESVKFGTKEVRWDASVSTSTCGTNGTAGVANNDQWCWYQIGTNLAL